MTPQTAVGVYSGEVPVAPQEMWDWVTVPSKRLMWQVGLTSVSEDVDDRRGVGTVNHCAHGGGMTLQRILDWHPFSTFTTSDITEGMDVVTTVTLVLTRSEEGTQFDYRFRTEPEEAWEQIGPMILASFEQARLSLLEVVAEDRPTR